MALAPLSRSSGHRFAAGTYDVRGWRVATLVDGADVGTVHDLIVDERGTPRYLDIDLGLLRKHVLLPIGQARAAPDERLVWVPGMTRDQFRHIPAYHHEPAGMSRDDEGGLIAAYASAYAGEEYRPRPAYGGTVYGPSELETPVAATGPGPLAPLSRLDDYRIPEDEPDPRGWRVGSAEGVQVGRIVDLLVDTRALRVDSLICELDAEPAEGEPGRRVLIPSGRVRLDEAERTVWVDGLGAPEIGTLPPFLDAEAGRDAAPDARVLAPSTDAAAFYDDPRFDAREFFGGRAP